MSGDCRLLLKALNGGAAEIVGVMKGVGDIVEHLVAEAVLDSIAGKVGNLVHGHAPFSLGRGGRTVTTQIEHAGHGESFLKNPPYAAPVNSRCPPRASTANESNSVCVFGTIDWWLHLHPGPSA